MKRITNIVSVFISLLSVYTYAQQNPHYTQYMYNMVIINPAYAGARADLTIGGLSRTQWVGIEGAPTTKTFSLNARVVDGLGLGLSVVNDKLGLMENTDFNLDLSYTLVMGYHQRLALGIKGGFSNFTNNLADGITPDNDIYATTNGTYPNVGIGAYYYNDNLFGGISVPQLFKTPKFRLDETYTAGATEFTNIFATFGMRFKLNDDLHFKPSTMVKYTKDVPLSVDLNSNFLYKEFIELGVSYRYDDSVSAMIAILPSKSMRIGYSYDYTLTNLGEFNSGSHEIILLFDIDFAKRSRWLKGTSCYF